MPTPFYRCGICKREHATYLSAVACEKSHVILVSSRVKSFGIWTYPQEIEVTFSNGQTRIYLAESLQ